MLREKTIISVAILCQPQRIVTPSTGSFGPVWSSFWPDGQGRGRTRGMTAKAGLGQGITEQISQKKTLGKMGPSRARTRFMQGEDKNMVHNMTLVTESGQSVSLQGKTRCPYMRAV